MYCFLIINKRKFCRASFYKFMSPVNSQTSLYCINTHSHLVKPNGDLLFNYCQHGLVLKVKHE